MLGVGVDGGLILLVVLFTSFYNIDDMGITQSDEMVYAIYGRESGELWAWWLSGADRIAFEQLVSSYGGSFNGGSFKKPLQHMAVTAIGFMTPDTAWGTRVWQAGFRVVVIFGPRYLGPTRSALGSPFFFA